MTGAHNMKFGYQGAFHRDDDNLFPTISNDQLMQLTLNNGVPNAFTIQSGPVHAQGAHAVRAFFAQDQWTKDRLTLQGALRFDRAWSRSRSRPSVRIRHDPDGDRHEAQSGITGYNDISPRIGVAYDVFGNGKTSLKANVGRYLHPASNQGRYINANPSERVSTITARPWTDTNGNFVPDCNVLRRSRHRACDDRIDRYVRPGPIRTSVARGPGTHARSVDPRWLGRAAVRLAVRRVGAAGSCAAGFRRSRVLPSVVADLRWRRRDGQRQRESGRLLAVRRHRAGRSATAERWRISGAWHLQHHAGGGAQRVRRTSSLGPTTFGDYKRYWDGFDITAQARLRNGLTLQGGTSSGRLVEDICDVRAQVPEVDDAGTLASPTNPYCRQPNRCCTTVQGFVQLPDPED